MATFSTVVRFGNRWKSWNTKPTLLSRKVASAFSLSAQMSVSSTRTEPESGAQDSGDDREERRLSAPRRPHDVEHLLEARLEGHVADGAGLGFALAEPLREPLGAYGDGIHLSLGRRHKGRSGGPCGRRCTRRTPRSRAPSRARARGCRRSRSTRSRARAASRGR